MVSQSLLNNTNVQVTSALGGMQVLEYVQDMSVSPSTSKLQYYMSRMNVNKRQLLLNLNGNGYTVQAGAMQWTAGQIQMESGVKGVGGFLSGMAKAAVTKETVAKPIYTGYGQVMLEPTYRHILLTNLQEWGGSVVLDDGLFLACDNTVTQKVVARSNLSSAVFGREGLFNLSLNGTGICALESIVPRNEIIEVVLDNDMMKIDGNMAIAGHPLWILRLKNLPNLWLVLLYLGKVWSMYIVVPEKSGLLRYWRPAVPQVSAARRMQVRQLRKERPVLQLPGMIR